MKTNTKHNQILKSFILTIMVFALFSTVAVAQRRSTDYNGSNNRVEQKAAPKTAQYKEKRESNQKSEYRKNTTENRSKRDSKGQYVNKHKGNDKFNQNHTIKNSQHHQSNKHYNSNKKSYKSDRYGSYYSTKWDHHYGHKDIHFKMRPDFHPRYDVSINNIAFRRVPRKSIWVNIEGINYVMYHGKFYHSSPFGFYRVYLPSHIKYLPEGCQEIWVNGHQLFRYHSIHFLSTPFGFKIIV